ncbi:hypothetical protein [Aneurinibacillus tyrosinisolvens]|uniref:phage terminase large subunit family protein n=1 Tax=Aneurinibacillus tyrosinisolvens TaxID=1443435 RepID=UPI00063F1047|nr:hypothetical protein [Aneurinibacillus tyrosinisolvens]
MAGEMVPFKYHDQQVELMENKQRFSIISKPRQLGVSVSVLSYFVAQAARKPNSAYMIFVHNENSKKILDDKLRGMMDSLPKMKNKAGEKDEYAEFVPQVKVSREGHKFDNGSIIYVEEVGSGQKGRGGSFSGILLSEFAFYSDDQHEKILTSMEDSLLKNDPEAVLFIESTSNGFNYHFELFRDSWSGNSKYKAFFFPYYSSAYRMLNENDLKLAKDLCIKKYGRELTENDLEGDEVRIYRECKDMDFIYWRRMKTNFGNPKDIKKFKQENPSHYMESFIGSSEKFFEEDSVMEAIKNLDKKPLQTVEGLPEELKPYLNKSLFIYELPKRTITDEEMDEIRLQRDEHMRILYCNRLFGTYMGVDVSQGMGQDSSVVSIFNKDKEQLAVFRTNVIPPRQLADIIAVLATWYNYSLVCVEANGVGYTVLEKLKHEIKYRNLYKMKRRLNDKNGKRPEGWISSATARSTMLHTFKEEWELGNMVIHDEPTLNQMLTFSENDRSRKEGHHFDTVFGTGLALEAIRNGKHRLNIFNELEIDKGMVLNA